MQGIYIYIPETNNVPREYIVAAILLLLFMVPMSLICGGVRYSSRYSECRLRYLLDGPRFEFPKSAENYSLLQETYRRALELTQPPIKLVPGNFPGGRTAGV
jgi:hypothetical protein